MSSTYTRPWLALSVLVAVAYGCGGQVRPLPDGGEANENGGGSNGGSSSSSGSPGGSSGSATGSSSGATGSSSGASATGDTCGGTHCSAGEVCCVNASASLSGDAAAASEACTAAAACKALALACGAASDCTDSEKCCVTFDILSALSGGSISGSSSCKATCPTSEGDGQLCATSAECASGVTCQATPMGGSVCGGIESLIGGAGGGL